MRAGRASRYATLDVWRGIAALAVVGFHCTNTLVARGRWAATDALLLGWVGVFVFFPISGYCITAALDTPVNGQIRRFLSRRWRRIMPTYWCSIGVAVGVAVAALPFNTASLRDLKLPSGTWLSVVTLTQTFIGEPGVVNPVYWSLCYEEQFYLVMALALLLPAAARPRLFVALTVAAGVYSIVARGAVPGLFLEYWIAFAIGVALYLSLHRPVHRSAAAAIALVAAATTAALGDLGLSVSVATGAALFVLHRWDDALACSAIGRWIGPLGTISYSLYLVHVPIGGRVVNLARRFDPQSGPAVAAVVLMGTMASVAAAVLFYHLVERRFKNPPALARTSASSSRLAEAHIALSS